MESLIRIKFHVVVLLCSLLMSQYSFSQTGKEFFKQKDTQRKYLIAQIAALRTYAGYLEQGYKVVQTGLKAVKDIKNGEFKLHFAFINSLQAVSPVIKNDLRIEEIISSQLSIRRTLSAPSSSKFLSPSERNYIDDVRRQVLQECNDDMEELLLIITSGRIEMKDDERLKRLDKVYASMNDKVQFAQSFKAKISLLLHRKENEQKSVTKMMKYYEKE